MKFRASTALWILSKFAIIFFILALLVIMTGYMANQKASICSQQAGIVAQSIRSSIYKVLNSPSEDELLLYKIPPALQLSSDDIVRYTIELIPLGSPSNPQNKLLIQVTGTSKDCSSALQVDYSFQDPRRIVNYFKIFGNIDVGIGSLKRPSQSDTDVQTSIDSVTNSPVYQLSPSYQQDVANRPKTLVIAKCSQKVGVSGNPNRFLVIHACSNQETPEINCLHFGTESTHGYDYFLSFASGPSGYIYSDKLCGWAAN